MYDLELEIGSTYKKMYVIVVERYRRVEITFKDTITFNLDEYVGLALTDSFSYRYYMEKHLFQHVDINKENVYIPDGLAKDLSKECEAFERAIDKVGPIHLQILVVGLNDNICFNEQKTCFNSRTH